MASITANGISLEYDRFGSDEDEPVLLIMGLGAQMTLWPIEFCEALVERGFHVIRYDNRDIGLSTKFDSAGVPDIAALMMASFMGKQPQAAYNLDDMAADAVGLLDALNIPRAHIVGASMGGMIAQLVAATYPDRTLSLTSIMSTTGNPAVPPARPEIMGVLTNRPAGNDPAEITAFMANAARMIGSPAYPADEARLRARVRADFERSYSPAGYLRQMAAIIASGDRRPKLAAITAPTLVIHGDADPLVPVEGGRDTADTISGATLKIIAGMGHDLPLQLVNEIADAIRAVALQSRVAMPS